MRISFFLSHGTESRSARRGGRGGHHPPGAVGPRLHVRPVGTQNEGRVVAYELYLPATTMQGFTSHYNVHSSCAGKVVEGGVARTGAKSRKAHPRPPVRGGSTNLWCGVGQV